MRISNDPKQRAPIFAVAGQLMGGINSAVPGLAAFMQPQPVLQISTGATATAQGQFSYAISGFNADELYDIAPKFLQKLYQYPGFLFVNSDLFNHTPNLQVEILRDQAKIYGVSETRILNLIHSSYSQNYSYLIKKPNNQYQVIIEVADRERSDPSGSRPAVHKKRRRPAHGSTQRRHRDASIHRRPIRKPHQPISQRHIFLQHEARLRHR